MKLKNKLLSVFLLAIFAMLLVGCDGGTTLGTTLPTTEEPSITSELTTRENITIEIDPVYPSYEAYNEENFTYADVRIMFSYDYPSDLTTNQEKRAYFESKNQEFYENSGLDQGQFDDVYLSSYSPFIGLTYRSKRDIIEDFDLIKQGFEAGFYGPPEIWLKTVGTYFRVDQSSTLADMVQVADQYFGTEIEYDLIPFTLIANQASMSVYQSKAYQSYQDYLLDFPSNLYEIEASLFDTQVLIIVSFGHSGSLTIEGIESVFYLDDETLEVAIQATASSIIMTEDYNPRTLVLSIAQEDFVSGVNIRPHFHTFFRDGTYADRPYHNSIDQGEDSE
jgi:hypothetical protein